MIFVKRKELIVKKSSWFQIFVSMVIALALPGCAADGVQTSNTNTANTPASPRKVVEAPRPEDLKNLVVETCTWTYFSRTLQGCSKREFVEEKNGSLVFAITGRTRKVTLVTNPELNVQERGDGAIFSPHSFQLQFPLAVGNRWSGTFQQGPYTRTRSAQIVNESPVTLKAGTFSAVEIRARNQRLDVQNPAHERYWYCPEILSVCKYESPEFDIRSEVVSVHRK